MSSRKNVLADVAHRELAQGTSVQIDSPKLIHALLDIDPVPVHELSSCLGLGRFAYWYKLGESLNEPGFVLALRNKADLGWVIAVLVDGAVEDVRLSMTWQGDFEDAMWHQCAGPTKWYEDRVWLWFARQPPNACSRETESCLGCQHNVNYQEAVTCGSGSFGYGPHDRAEVITLVRSRELGPHVRQARRHRVPNDKRSRVNAVVEEGPVEVAIVPIPAHAVDTADLLTGEVLQAGLEHDGEGCPEG